MCCINLQKQKRQNNRIQQQQQKQFVYTTDFRFKQERAVEGVSQRGEKEKNTQVVAFLSVESVSKHDIHTAKPTTFCETGHSISDIVKCERYKETHKSTYVSNNNKQMTTHQYSHIIFIYFHIHEK